MVRSDFNLPFTVDANDVSWYDNDGHVDKSIYKELPITGLLRIEEKTLCFQFRRTPPSVSLSDWMGGEREKKKPEIEEICVPLDHIREATLKRARWFTSRMTLHANDLHAFEEIPGGMGIRIILRIAKEHLDLAESFISRLHVKLSEHTIRHLNDDLETPP